MATNDLATRPVAPPETLIEDLSVTLKSYALILAAAQRVAYWRFRDPENLRLAVAILANLVGSNTDPDAAAEGPDGR